MHRHMRKRHTLLVAKIEKRVRHGAGIVAQSRVPPVRLAEGWLLKLSGCQELIVPTLARARASAARSRAPALAPVPGAPGPRHAHAAARPPLPPARSTIGWSRGAGGCPPWCLGTSKVVGPARRQRVGVVRIAGDPARRVTPSRCDDARPNDLRRKRRGASRAAVRRRSGRPTPRPPQPNGGPGGPASWWVGATPRARGAFRRRGSAWGRGMTDALMTTDRLFLDGPDATLARGDAERIFGETLCRLVIARSLRRNPGFDRFVQCLVVMGQHRRGQFLSIQPARADGPTTAAPDGRSVKRRRQADGVTRERRCRGGSAGPLQPRHPRFGIEAAPMIGPKLLGVRRRGSCPRPFEHSRGAALVRACGDRSDGVCHHRSVRRGRLEAFACDRNRLARHAEGARVMLASAGSVGCSVGR